MFTGGQLEDAAEKIHRLLQPIDLSEPQDNYPKESNMYVRQIKWYLRALENGIKENAKYR